MATFVIPLQNVPQSFEIQLGTKVYGMSCRWNDSLEGGWFLDFVDAITGESVVANLPLIVGADVLDGLGYLGFEGRLFVYTDGAPLTTPTLENLGVESNLYFVTEDA